MLPNAHKSMVVKIFCYNVYEKYFSVIMQSIKLKSNPLIIDGNIYWNTAELIRTNESLEQYVNTGFHWLVLQVNKV